MCVCVCVCLPFLLSLSRFQELSGVLHFDIFKHRISSHAALPRPYPPRLPPLRSNSPWLLSVYFPCRRAQSHRAALEWGSPSGKYLQLTLHNKRIPVRHYVHGPVDPGLAGEELERRRRRQNGPLPAQPLKPNCRSPKSHSSIERFLLRWTYIRLRYAYTSIHIFTWKEILFVTLFFNPFDFVTNLFYNKHTSLH